MAGSKQKKPLDDVAYNEALVAWLAKPSVSHVVFETGLSRVQVKQLVESGIPEIGCAPLPPAGKSRKSPRKSKPVKAPLPTDHDTAAQHYLARTAASQQITEMKQRLALLEDDGTAVAQAAGIAEAREELAQTSKQLDIAEKRLGNEAKRIANVEERVIAADNIEQAATEAALARSAMRNVMNIGAALEHLTEKLLEAVAEGKCTIPEELDAKTISTLATAIDKLTTATERAIKIDKGRSGESEDNLGLQIGILLNACTPIEIQQVIDNHGELPERIRHTINATVVDMKDV